MSKTNNVQVLNFILSHLTNMSKTYKFYFFKKIEYRNNKNITTNCFFFVVFFNYYYYYTIE